MVDIVAAKAGADELLEEIGLLVRALGRAEPGQRPVPVTVADAPGAGSGEIERLLPVRLAEMSKRVRRVDVDFVLRNPFLADQRLCQPVRVGYVIEAEAALDAQPVVVGRAVASVDGDDAILADLVGQ